MNADQFDLRHDSSIDSSIGSSNDALPIRAVFVTEHADEIAL